jgi:hypothetical protein
MPDSADDGLSLSLFAGTSQRHLNLALPTISPWTTNCACHGVFVCMRVFCNCLWLCSPMLFVHVYTLPCLLMYSLLIQLYGFVSFYTQLLFNFFISLSSPLLFSKLLIIFSVKQTLSSQVCSVEVILVDHDHDR